MKNGIEQKKSILFIIPTLSGGGAEKTVVNLAMMLKDDYKVNIVVFSDDKLVVLDDMINCINLDIKYTANPLKKIYNTIRKIIKIRRIKKEMYIDFSISFLKRPSLLNVLTSYKEKKIVSFRNKMSEQDGNWIQKQITKFICFKADKIISLSNMVKYDLEETYKVKENKIVVIYNPCDVKYIEKMKKEKLEKNFLDKIENKKVILNIGRLSKQKGQENLILAFYELQKELEDCVLLILGKGEEEKKLLKLVENLNIGDKVIFKGYVKNPYKYMKYSDIFVFSSIYEGLGNALLEAAGAGMAIISTDCKYGPKEILDPTANLFGCVSSITKAEFGILIPPFEYDVEKNKKNINILKVVMKELLCDIELRDYYRKQSVQRSFDFLPMIIKKQWIKIIEGI